MRAGIGERLLVGLANRLGVGVNEASELEQRGIFAAARRASRGRAATTRPSARTSSRTRRLSIRPPGDRDGARPLRRGCR
jgi:hypothetical protein